MDSHKKQLTLNPQQLLAALGVSINNTVADFGCGPGFFALPAAQIVSNNGKVHCFDILPAALETVESRAKLMGISNVHVQRVNLEKSRGSELSDESVDHVIMRNILWQNTDRALLLKEAHRVLKTGGTLLVVSWRSDLPIGPPEDKRISEEDMCTLAQSAEFDITGRPSAGEHHYALVCTKKEK